MSREEGGHIRIFPKRKVTDRTKLTQQEAVDLIRLTMIVGEALQTAMNSKGINVVKINYEDLGNWAFKKNKPPVLHIHIFGRVPNAKYQVFPEAVQLPDRSTGFYDNFVALDDEDVKAIREQIEQISRRDEYSLEKWGLSD